MFKSYFILNRLITELNEQLQGFNITRAFSFEKEKLVLVLSNKEELIIEISVNSGFPYLHPKRRFSIPKKNLIDIFSSYLPLNNIYFEIADDDRIIRIQSDKGTIYFAIRGKYTNVYLINNSEIQSFKKADEDILENFRKEVLDHKFISEFLNINFEEDYYDSGNLRKKYPIIGKEILNEIILRENDQIKISGSIIQKVIREIKENKPALFIDGESGEVKVGIETFNIFPFTRKEKFENLIETLNHFLIEKFSADKTVDKKKIIEKFLDRELSKISGKLNNIKTQLQRGSKEDDYRKKGDILLININKIIRGRDVIEVQDIFDNNNIIVIKLDPKLSPKQNVDLYFERSKNERVKFEKSKLLYSDLSKKYGELLEIKNKFLSAKSDEDLDSIMKELKIKREEKSKPEDEIKNKFRHYLVHNKYNVYVGKDGRSNDLLTMKFAKQNDYWFHARSVPGSHLVLKNDNPKEGIPKNILKIAASIAAFHSKAKTSGMSPVSYTQKKYVTKKKGMEPGKVALLREEVLIVKPEIPQDCEYISNE